MTPGAAWHIQLHDPDRTARLVTAVRRLMSLIDEVAGSYPVTAHALRTAVASIWDDHEDYQGRRS